MAFTSGDIIVTVLLIASAALMIRIRREPGRRSNYLWIGLVLGLGFLTKAAVIILIPIILIELPLLFGRRDRGGLRNPGPYMAAGTAILIILPFIICLSVEQGRFTVGGAGPVNYSWQVTGMSLEGYKEEAYWPGSSARHPVKLLLDNPRVISLEDHLVGWFPLHYDPVWWCDGYPVRFDRARQFFILGNNIAYSGIILGQCPGLWLAAICSFALFKRTGSRIASLWYIWLPGLAMSGAYCLVYVLPRYIAGPFALLGFVMIAGAWDIPLARVQRRMATLVIAALSITVLREEIYGIPIRYLQLAVGGAMPWEFHNAQIADFMSSQGLRNGDRVAYIGNALSAAWVGLDGAQIVAFVPTRTTHNDSELGRPLQYSFENTDSFWRASPENRQRVFSAFRRAGARWVVADEVPGWADTTGWQIAGTSGVLREGDRFATLFQRLAPPDR